jgi:Holliday junction resolvase RusA-like endonuclease
MTRSLLDDVRITGRFWHFKIDGDPQPWKRKGGFGNRSYNPSRNAQKDIAWAVRACCPSMMNEDENLLWGVRLAFRSKRIATTDVDNLAKNFLDALQGKGMCWTNDRCVREIYAIAVPDPVPCTEGVIYLVTPDYLASWSVLR